MEKHILVVDDSAVIRLAVTSCLREAGFVVTEAVNGRDALERLESIRERDGFVSLVVTDVNMPEMDGITLIGKLREGHFKFVPILVLTTETDKSVVELGRFMGASGWLRKPFEPGLLLQSIEKLVWSK